MLLCIAVLIRKEETRGNNITYASTYAPAYAVQSISITLKHFKQKNISFDENIKVSFFVCLCACNIKTYS